VLFDYCHGLIAHEHKTKGEVRMSKNFTMNDTAVVLVDHQVGTINWAGELTPEEREQLKMWVRVFARFAKAAGMPVVLTSSLETEAQGPLLPDFQTILPAEYAARVKRVGVINAWDDPNFATAVRNTGKKNLIMSGLTTDVCLVPPALSARAEGFNVIALLDQSGACTKTAASNSRQLLADAGVKVLTTIPMITSLLGDYTNPASGAWFQAMAEEKVFDLLGKGDIR
jgi:nicotinamidase-related amidase